MTKSMGGFNNIERSKAIAKKKAPEGLSRNRELQGSTFNSTRAEEEKLSAIHLT